MIFWLRSAENADIVTTTPAFGSSMSRPASGSSMSCPAFGTSMSRPAFGSSKSRPAFGTSMSRFRPESVSTGTVALALTVVAHVADLLYHLFGFLVVVVVVIA